MEPIISVRDLGKRYRIRSGECGRSQSLREELVTVANKLIRGKVWRSKSEDFWALKDIDFDIHQGEVVGVIGSNGAGKSTLLKILSRITQPTTGEVILKGRVGSLLEVGAGFHPELTGRENIFMNGTVLGMKRADIKKKFDEIVAFSGIEKFINTPVKRYSSGMYVRLAFAVAAHLEPEILIVDEVLAVGDVSFQKKCLGKMEDVANAGRTVLFVSHNLTAIRSLCKRAILLDKGQIQRDDRASKVVQLYLKSDDQINSQKVWQDRERPGNQSFKLNSVKLKNSEGLEVSHINISEDAYIEISYDVIIEDTKICFSLVLFSADGTCVFSSLSNLETEFYNKKLKLGKYIAKCQIYNNLLNQGEYYISIIGFSSNWTEPFRENNVIHFQAVDDGILKRDYFGNFGGYIRPRLQWKTLKI